MRQSVTAPQNPPSFWPRNDIYMQNRSTNVTPLSDVEHDALTEIGNIAMGRAATSLGRMIGREVRLTVPSVQILSVAEALQTIRRLGPRELIAVTEEFRGLFKGRLLLIFPEKNSLELVRAVIGEEMPFEDLTKLEEDAIAETGNIVLNSWTTTVSNLLKRNLVITVPQVVRGGGQKLFAGMSLKFVLFLQIDFSISETPITGYVALMMDLPSMRALRSVIGEYIAAQR
jgi:chemotaxis protein CheC